MKIAIEGCAHGELDKIYECIETIQERENFKVDLLICCGDFQSVRNEQDLRAMAVPEKYQKMCTFHKYYSGEKIAPVLTLFIGGNHEASNYLQELPYGGWVAPNIYYMGRAGVVKFGNLRIGGLSGIFKGRDYQQGLWECPPYNPSSLRSVYHIRALDVFRLSQIKDKLNIMLSHDWPRGITDYGDKEQLLKRKPFLREDIESNELGSPPAEQLLHTLKPDYWFSAHLHCQFVSVVHHDDDCTTKFLALDKCLPRRRHLQLLDLSAEYDGDKILRYDEEWLAILKNTNHLLSVKNINCYMPGPGGNERYDFTPTDDEKAAVKNVINEMEIKKENFVQTAPVYSTSSIKGVPTDPIMNPQTINFCESLGIDDPLQVVLCRTGREFKQPYSTTFTNLVQDKHTALATPEVTPIKLKMSLPDPITPVVEDLSHNDTILSSQSRTFVSDTSLDLSLNSSCLSTPSASGKKLLKRRNQAIYTTDTNDSLSNSLSDLYDSGPSKKSSRENSDE